MKTKFFCFLFSFTIAIFTSCAQKETKKIKKINGISFVASKEEVIQEYIEPVKQLNANYAAVMPFGFVRNLEHPEILFDTDRQWFGERKEGVAQYISMLHKNNIHVMLKPQIWVSRGEFTGFLKMPSEADWVIFESSYSTFILEFAQLAEENNVALFCIGTELEQFIVHRPEYWNRLISDIKKVYNGKLTYAANWDEYKRVPFWKDLDYIGVDAYFPISVSKTPTVEESKKGWERWKNELKTVSEREKKSILFTEYGYRSLDFAGKEPWLSNRELTTVNLAAQTNTTQALFEEIWNEPWFAGGFLWKWFIDHYAVGGETDSQYTPQNKPVEQVIRNHYKSFF